MKKILLIITALTLLVSSSCKKKAEEMTFNFSNATVTENSVGITVTPSDLERDYFLGILPSENVKDKADAEIISEGGVNDAFKKFRGEKTYGIEQLQPETDYVALAFSCLDAEKVARYTMRTLEATQDSIPDNPEEPEDPEDPENPEEPEDPEDPETIVVELKANKTEILNDGIDKVTFSVTVDEEVMTDGYQILNVQDSTAINSDVFSTTIAGSYTFVAIYNDVYSNDIVIEVKEVEEPEVPVVELKADKTEIINNGVDMVTFTVLADNEILTEGYQILNVENNIAVNDNVFSTTTAGIYTFVATYDNVSSNEVVIEVKAEDIPDPVVELIADKNVIKNNGTDEVTFTVLVDGENLTSESVIFNVTDNVNLSGNTFSSNEVGSYVFHATYNGFQSGEITIEVISSQSYSPGDLYDVNGVRGVVFYVEEGGTSGLIMSMDQAFLQWSTENVWANCISNHGEWNTEDMLKLGEEKYPAAKWCVDHGEGWYMPSSYEMNLMWHAVSNGTYDFDGEFVKLYNDKLDDPILEDYYWSSNEISEDMAEVVVFIDSSVVCLDPFKSNYFHVRAIHKF